MMLISEAAKAMNAKVIGADAAFESVGADSRKISQGQLFVALKGENFDGHTFAKQALAQGASAVLVENESTQAQPALVVKDTLLGLGQLASYWRQKFTIPIAAVTGSNGKTTVKEMLASILRAAVNSADEVLATEGNLNNHIGSPMTLLKLRPQHRYAVIEMGMNHSGEISYLTNLAKPRVAVIVNAGSAHIGELGSFEAIAKAKGEIFEGLADDGIAVINADDVFASLWQGLAAERKTVTFGLNNNADISATYELKPNASKLCITTPQGVIDLLLPAPGLHNVMNALAATATATAMEISLPAIKTGLQNYAGVKGRLQHLEGLNGALVIDDCYNANPMSMKAAIDVLIAQAGEKLLVLGDMGELGKDAAALHAEIGAYAKDAGVHRLFTLGQLSEEMIKAFGAHGQHYKTPQDLVADLLKELKQGVTVLVKGSRFMAMERIVNEIILKDETQKNIAQRNRAQTNGESH
ncbi:MAG: UDP-N-acetylmuramoyl-tripeptide--D-alanyl-D-alanine ligase [Methylotenera sp.]|nr:UDP-N-acetylmuramoyl-tripeptide--D-alanyl-D-alanine ligase [Methylotenera sp.]